MLRWENGDSVPDIVTVIRWATALEVELTLTVVGPTAAERRLGDMASSLGRTRAVRALGRAAKKRSA